MCDAVGWVTPTSCSNCFADILHRVLAIRYMAWNQIRSDADEPSKMVPFNGFRVVSAGDLRG
jgi:hypothetical protein